MAPDPSAAGSAVLPLLTRRTLLELMDRHDLAPHRTLGQNYVVDPNTIRRIVRLARVGAGERVVEIGSGLGSLTLGLLEVGADVTAIEIDRRVEAAFGEVTAGRARLVIGDALELPVPDLLGTDDRTAGAVDGPITVVANLPYNVATTIVLRLLDDVPPARRLLVMVQREAAERLAAPAGHPARGIPSVKVEQWASARVVGSVSAEVFHPRPRVASSLVLIERRDSPVEPASPFDLLLRRAFGQRRKMLRRSLESVVGPSEFAAAGVPETARPESLTLEQWLALALACERGPS